VRKERFLTRHIGLLVWAFAPPASTAIAARPEPRISWIARTALITRFGTVEPTDRGVSNAAAPARAG
jgi:hypothetical protein